MGAIALTVVSINGQPVVPTIYGFDIDEISQPISNDGTYSLVTVRTYNKLDLSDTFIEKRYEVQETLSAIVSLSDELFLGDVIYYRGRTPQYAVSYQRVFPLQKVKTIFNSTISGTQFNFFSNENIPPVFYEITQTIIQIINQLSPSGTYWALDGNTVTSTKGLGTKDNYDLPIITNNVEVARFDTGGNFGLGTSTPLYLLDLDTANSILVALARFTNNTNSFKIFTSNSSPETVITADMGDICVVNDGVNGQIYLKYSGLATNTGWVSLYFTVSLTAGTGISITGSSPSFTITNSAPDQVVSLTSGTGISTSGTYPNFTITNSSPDQIVALTAGSGISISGTYPNFTITATGSGTVTAVTASTPLSSSGGSTPNITIQQSSSSQDGYLSSTDWTTFNNKVSSVGAGTGISIGGTSTNPTVTNTAPDQIVALTQGGTTTITGTYPNFTISSADQYNGTVTSVSALTLGTSGTDLSSSVANGTTTPAITLNVPTASATNRGALSSTDWSTFNGKQDAITLTTTGTSGAATLVGATLNIPQYAGTPVAVADEGSTLTSAVTSINFTGAGVAATNVGSAVTVTINGGGGGTSAASNLFSYYNFI